MKLYIFLLAVVFAICCSEKSKFKGTAVTGNVQAPKEVVPVVGKKNVESEPKQEPKPEPEPKDETVSKEVKPPGVVPAIRIGVNFEDIIGEEKDNDYNDAVLCFEGDFDFDSKATTIVATKDQNIIPKTFSSSDCLHDISVEIIRPDGSTSQKAAFSSRPSTVSLAELKFKKGDRLEVYMKPNEGRDTCSPEVNRDMHNPKYAEVEVDKCNGLFK